ncbi:MAG: GNAT family N-acetyltransferase [Nitrososphaerales archaeon]
MSEENALVIDDVPLGQRKELFPILEDSFEGWYLRHSKRTALEIGLVRQAKVGQAAAGLVMLKDLGNKLGYVYYIAVAKQFRGKGIGGKLLDNSIEYFATRDFREVYAGIEEDNEESSKLFLSRGFRKITRGELAKKYGTMNSFLLMRKMLIVYGEILLMKELDLKIA